MDSKNIESLLEEVLSNLVFIRDLLEIQNEPLIKAKINELASTSQRRKMWILSNGKISSMEMAKKLGVSTRYVRYFMDDGRKAGIIVSKRRGYPKRRFDYIPEDWPELEEIR